jgi:putative copper export protein
VGPGFTWQDLVHTSAAVIGFAGASWVMLQVASDARLKRLARFSLVAALAVALIAATGGILSLLQFGTEVGGLLELVATTVALTWLVGLSLFLAIETSSASPRDESRTSEAVDAVQHRAPERVDLPPAVY